MNRTALALVPVLASACMSSDEVIINGYRFINKAGSVAQAMEGARETFESANSCPEDRITITPRPDLERTSRPTEPALAPWIPPDDIAADPGRLEIWRRTHRAEIQVHEMEADRRRMQSSFVDAAGCGIRTTYFCSALYKHPERASCGTATADDEVKQP